MESGRLFSVGHSNLDADAFLALLAGAGVTAVADVRSSPFSRRLPQFNRPHLEALLREKEVAYTFLGGLLGGRPADPALYHPDGWADYARVRATPAFQRGLDHLQRGLEEGFAVALMCAEEDPLDCHRGLMVAPALKELGLRTLHLRKGGAVETMEEMEDRLLRELRRGPDLFQSPDEVLAGAYREMNARKAYRPRDEGERGG